MRYCIFDPTGNITALVESPTPVKEQPAAAAAIMAKHPEVEQVGFVDFAGEPSLRMAGGEFCGNASMSAAALYLLRVGQRAGELALRVSGADEPVRVRLHAAEGGFSACVRMPRALGVEERCFSFDALSGRLTLVRMQGISHLIVPAASVFFSLLQNREAAERAIRRFCAELNAEGLGLMFLAGDRLTPLVYVPGSNTVFWENSCASGSAAVGIRMADKTKAPVSLALREPGGILRVESKPGGDTWLSGHTRLVCEVADGQ